MAFYPMKHLLNSMIVPSVLTAALILSAAFQFSLALKPSVLLQVIFFSSLMPALAPSYFGLFILGIVDDAINGMPLGFSSFLYIIFSMMVRNNSHALLAQRFWVVWAGFAGLVMLLELIETAMKLIFSIDFIASNNLLNLVLTCLCYPIMHALLKFLVGLWAPRSRVLNA